MNSHLLLGGPFCTYHIADSYCVRACVSLCVCLLGWTGVCVCVCMCVCVLGEQKSDHS